MRLFTATVSLFAALTLATACGDDGGDGSDVADAALPDVDAEPQARTFSMTLTLNGYGMAHNGDTLYFSLWDDADASAAVATTSKTIMSGGGGGGGGGNEVTFADALVEGHSYTLYWYADLDANTMCDMGSDHHWSMTASAITADVPLVHQHTATFNGDCTKQ